LEQQIKKTEETSETNRISEEGKRPEKGNKVKIQYSGRVVGGYPFDTSKTIEFVVGQGEVEMFFNVCCCHTICYDKATNSFRLQVIVGLDEAIKQMCVGQTAQIHVKSSHGVFHIFTPCFFCCFFCPKRFI
jgi:FKBP-type peptidyl-prolyl cis-trans isomerase